MSALLSSRLLAAQSDQRLVELSRQGNERAFELIVRRYRRPLLRYCGRMGLAPARAEDVVQQTLLQAWLAIQRDVEVRQLRPWLFRIAHNTAINALRRPEAVQPLNEALQVAAAATAEPEQVLALRAALSGVAELPQMQRDVILLSAVDGRSHEEVASALGISEGAVRGLLYRARAALRAAAAALTPAPLLAWAERSALQGGGGGGGLPELTAAGGAAGVGGALIKGAAIAVSTVAVVAGAVKLHGGGTGVKGHHGASAAAALGHGAGTTGPPAGAPTVGAPAPGRTGGAATGDSHAGRGTAGGGAVTSAPRRVTAGLGPSGTSFSQGGGGGTGTHTSPHPRRQATESEPAASTPVTTSPSTAVKAAAVQAPASSGTGTQSTPASTQPAATTPAPNTTPGVERAPPVEKTAGGGDDHEPGTEKPPTGGEPEKEHDDSSGTEPTHKGS